MISLQLRLGHLSASTGPRKNICRAFRNQDKIGPKVTGTTDMTNTLRVPLEAIIHTGRSILLRQSKSRSPEELVRWWLTSCNKFACAKHLLYYWAPVRKKMPLINSRDWALVRKIMPLQPVCSAKKVPDRDLGNGMYPILQRKATLLNCWCRALVRLPGFGFVLRSFFFCYIHTSDRW